MAISFPEQSGLQAGDIRSPHYQQLKGRVHQELLGRLNLERLTRVKREDAEPEIRGLIIGLLDRESTPLSLFERDCLITDVLHEIFGLGPARGSSQGWRDFRHPGQPPRSGVRRA